MTGQARDGGGSVMELTVLAVPGCPNAPLLERRLAGLLAGRPEARVSLQVVSSEDEAARLGMCGSPTLLINGTDPFHAPGLRPALACRLYRGDEGRLEGAPGVPALRRVLTQEGLAG